MKSILSATILTLLISLIGCSADAPPSAAAATPQPTTDSNSQPQSSEDFVASGPIVVEEQVDVTAQREGIVTDIMVDTGTLVRKGQLLAKLDDRQLMADRDAAKAQSDSIEADLKNWEATVKMEQVDLDRSEKMFAANLIPQEQVDHARFKLTATKYEFDREQKNFQRSLDVVKSLELELEKTRIVAPFGGVVARRYIRVGQRAANGDKLFWVSAMRPMHVKFTLPEKYAGKVQRGSLLEILPAESPGETHTAKVILISPVIDPVSGTVDVTAELGKETGSLRPGMITNIRLTASR